VIIAKKVSEKLRNKIQMSGAKREVEVRNGRFEL
jgi:hypothetical protein